MIDTVKITGAQVCDYIWYVNRRLTNEEKEMVSDRTFEPSWTPETGLLVTFNNSLLAGNITDGNDTPTTWKIYRREVGSDNLEPVAVMSNSIEQVTDYNIKNNKEYEYSIFAETDTYITSSIKSQIIKTAWKNWCLFSVDETSVANQYKLHEAFLFEYGLTPSQMSNNLLSAKYNNFTKFPKVLKGQSNYYSGSISSLLGYYDCTKHKYIDDAIMLDALSAFTTDSRLKFLKDIYGHIWQVEVTEALTATPNHFISGSQYNITLGWSQTGNTDGLLIIN